MFFARDDKIMHVFMMYIDIRGRNFVVDELPLDNLYHLFIYSKHLLNFYYLWWQALRIQNSVLIFK